VRHVNIYICELVFASCVLATSVTTNDLGPYLLFSLERYRHNKRRLEETIKRHQGESGEQFSQLDRSIDTGLGIKNNPRGPIRIRLFFGIITLSETLTETIEGVKLDASGIENGGGGGKGRCVGGRERGKRRREKERGGRFPD
jgi:hypothetical protein